MPKQILSMLKELEENGSNNDARVLSAGVKATLEIVAENSKCMKKVNTNLEKHLNDKDCHTPKGILVRTDVIKWFLAIVFAVSMVAQYVPGIIKWFIGLF